VAAGWPARPPTATPPATLRGRAGDASPPPRASR